MADADPFIKLLSLAVISDHFAISSENTMRNQNSTPPKLEKPARKMGGEAAIFGALFLSFGGWNSGFS